MAACLVQLDDAVVAKGLLCLCEALRFIPGELFGGLEEADACGLFGREAELVRDGLGGQGVVAVLSAMRAVDDGDGVDRVADLLEVGVGEWLEEPVVKPLELGESA